MVVIFSVLLIANKDKSNFISRQYASGFFVLFGLYVYLMLNFFWWFWLMSRMQFSSLQKLYISRRQFIGWFTLLSIIGADYYLNWRSLRIFLSCCSGKNGFLWVLAYWKSPANYMQFNSFQILNGIFKFHFSAFYEMQNSLKRMKLRLDAAENLTKLSNDLVKETKVMLADFEKKVTVNAVKVEVKDEANDQSFISSAEKGKRKRISLSLSRNWIKIGFDDNED